MIPALVAQTTSKEKKAAHGRDWFALGGILIREEDEQKARDQHAAFLKEWPQIKGPLHSVEIRARNKNFLWLEDLEESEREIFLEALYCFMRDVPVIGLACVIDRPGYNHRYFEKYGRQPWSLCKTAFSVAAERGAKYARSIGRRLRVCPERCTKTDDAALKDCYDEMRQSGMPFSDETSGKYAPLSSDELRATFYEFRPKHKSSPMAQTGRPISLANLHGRLSRQYAALCASYAGRKADRMPRAKIGLADVSFQI